MSESAQDGTPAQDPDPWEIALDGLDLLVLDPTECHVHGDGRGRLWGTVLGREHTDLRAYRTFPLTAPDWISLVSALDADDDGRRSDGERPERVELGVLNGTDGLDTESRQSITDALRLRYFLPQLLSIAGVREEAPGQSGAVVWDLLTDRGPMQLRMRNLFEGFQQFQDGRIVLSDHEGNRVDIPAVDALDGLSRRFLLRYYWL